MDGFLENYDGYDEWIGKAGTRPLQSLIGIQRLVLPELMVEIEAVERNELSMKSRLTNPERSVQ